MGLVTVTVAEDSVVFAGAESYSIECLELALDLEVGVAEIALTGRNGSNANIVAAPIKFRSGEVLSLAER